jgi:CBS domain-containing protein
MLFPVRQLIEGLGKPECIAKTATIQEALALMIKKDYSQLPILKEDGSILGMVSEQSIIKGYFHTGGNVSLMQLHVNDCMERPHIISPDSDIFEALDLLKNFYAIIVVEDRKPLAVLTNYDTTHYFRDFSEGLILVEDIEVSLRSLIEITFTDQRTYREALQKILGPHSTNEEENIPELENFTFRDILLVITKNWPAFEKTLGDRGMFINVMEPIREIRNQLAHFRGKIEPIQRDALLNARTWLGNHLPIFKEETAITHIQEQEIKLVKAPKSSGKYGGMQAWLSEHSIGVNYLSLSFEHIETILGDKLPEFASIHQAWWGNDAQTHPQARAWLQAGFLVESVDLENRRIILRRSRTPLYQLFYLDLLERIKKIRPGLTRVARVTPQNWLWIANAKPGFGFYWSFNKKHEFQIELFIEMADTQANKNAFDQLQKNKNDIEQKFGKPLDWQRLDHRKGSRVCFAVPAEITDPEEVLEKVKEFAIENTLRFIDILQPYIGKLGNMTNL